MISCDIAQVEVAKLIELYEAFEVKVKQRIAEYRTMFEANIAKERVLKKTCDIFWKSEDNQIKDCNRVMTTCEQAMLQSSIFGKGIKPNLTLLKSLIKDLSWIFTT